MLMKLTPGCLIFKNATCLKKVSGTGGCKQQDISESFHCHTSRVRTTQKQKN